MTRNGNPFVTERPVEGEDLCGREPALERLGDLAPAAPPAVVSGEPGSGFTSLARELARRWSRAGRPALVLDLSLAEEERDARSLLEGASPLTDELDGLTVLLDGVGRLGDPPELEGVLSELPTSAGVVLLGPAAERALTGTKASAAIELDRIPFAAWLPYTLERFLRTDRWIGDEHVAACVERAGGHARTTTALLAEVWARAGERRVDSQTVDRAWSALLGRAGGGVLELLAGLTANQRRVLRGLAAEAGEGAEVRPYASDFLQRHRLSSPSSVQRCLQSLAERRLIHETELGPAVRDPLLAAWLRRWPEREGRPYDAAGGHGTYRKAET